MDKINKETGLTPLQEKAVALIVNGKTYTETARELKIDRSTIYNWSDKINFQAYYNMLISEVRKDVINELHSFHSDAVKVIRDSLNSKNDNVKIKVAIWLIEKLENRNIGQSNPRKWISDLCTSNEYDFQVLHQTFNENQFHRLCEENNLDH